MNPLNLILLLMYLVEPATPMIAGTAQVIPVPVSATAPDASEARPLAVLAVGTAACPRICVPIDAESPAAAITLPCPASGMPGSR